MHQANHGTRGALVMYVSPEITRNGSSGRNMQATAAKAPINPVAPNACNSTLVSSDKAWLRATFGKRTAASGAVKKTNATPTTRAAL